MLVIHLFLFFFSFFFLFNDTATTEINTTRHTLSLHDALPIYEIIPELLDPRDLVVRGKKRYSVFHATDLAFVLRRLGVDTVILAGINTTTCVLCAGFEATNLD